MLFVHFKHQVLRFSASISSLFGACMKTGTFFCLVAL
jgi:hypothetical protein